MVLSKRRQSGKSRTPVGRPGSLASPSSISCWILTPGSAVAATMCDCPLGKRPSPGYIRLRQRCPRRRIGHHGLGTERQGCLGHGWLAGFGRAICLGLAGEGARVAINYRRQQQRAAELAELIRSVHGTKALPVPGDVSDPDDIRTMFDRCETELGPLDVLVNNAGIWPRPACKTSPRRTGTGRLP